MTGGRSDAVVEAATLSLNAAALQKAREAAEAANLAKTRYLVGVSHEIRSPLNAIYGYAQLLERDGAIDAVEAGRVIRTASEHLINIVEGLLDISRIESGVHKLDRNVVALPQFVEGVVSMMRAQAEAKGLNLNYAPPRNLPAYVRTDEKRLRQILINLISNAIKYTPSGSVTVALRYRSFIADFEIADTGIGIAPDDISDIFEPFNRGSSPLAQSQSGTGLGLAITRMLAQIMGGDVSAASTVGEGSTFRLRLMLPESAHAKSLAFPRGGATGYAGTRRTVLVIDDDPAQRQALERLLQPLGFTIHAASGGAEGLELAARHAPDLILLDIQLGDMSGWDLLPRLRSLRREASADGVDRGQKILMISANAHELAGGANPHGGHDGAVLKPIRFETLLDAIANTLGLVWDILPARDSADEGPAALHSAVPAERTGRLRYLAQMGHVRALDQELDVLDREFPDAPLPIELLRRHLSNFDMIAFLGVLDPYG